MNISTIKHILIIQVARIGDTLLVIPAVKAIADYFPQAEITVLAHSERYELLLNLPFIKKVIPINKFLASIKSIVATKKYDLAFVYGSTKPYVNLALKSAHKVIAFKQEDNVLNQQLTVIVNPDDQNKDTAVDFLLRLPQAVGINNVSSRRLLFSLTEKEQLFAQQKLTNLLAKNNFLVGFQVASFPTRSYRDWPIEYFSQLAQQLKANNPNTHIVILGGKAEYERVAWLAEQLKGYVTILAGQLNLRETAACMSLLDLYVGIDTGPTHLMGCFDKPMVVLYHHTPEQLKPIDHPYLVTIAHPDVAKAGEHDMAAITVDEVMAACKTVVELKKL
ncbi:glycosyltransferase family 9 protein [Thiofilum flexile]|uniref:glycosyltransferase family 9 protein n=1 Tax=Thiofilum flexile TaxID=125627 RepID=UPI0003683C96|nr:glycosyltransferase family 9 protein [Thiofilum flexile]